MEILRAFTGQPPAYNYDQGTNPVARLRFNILMGLREIEQTFTGENKPYQFNKVNDSEEKKPNYIANYRNFLENIDSSDGGSSNMEGDMEGGIELNEQNINLSDLANIFALNTPNISPGGLEEQLLQQDGGGSNAKTLAGLGGTGVVGVGAGAGAISGAMLGATALGATAGATAGVIGTGVAGIRFITRPTVFEDFLTLDEKYDILQEQLRVCMDNQISDGRRPTIAALFGHQHQLRGLLGLKRDDEGEKYGIGNNSIIIFERPDSLLTCKVLEPKIPKIIGVDDNELIAAYPDHPTKYFAKDKGYHYLKEEQEYTSNEIDNWGKLNILMDYLGLKILIFHRHGMAMHNFLGTMAKTNNRILIRNSRLLPGDMLINGPLMLIGMKLAKHLQLIQGLGIDIGDTNNIVWGCSELVRTMQSLITVRSGYEMFIAAPQGSSASNTYNNARIQCLRHSLQPISIQFIQGQYEMNKEKDINKAMQLVDSMIAIQSAGVMPLDDVHAVLEQEVPGHADRVPITTREITKTERNKIMGTNLDGEFTIDTTLWMGDIPGETIASTVNVPTPMAPPNY